MTNINVTKIFLPQIKEYVHYLDKIWASNIVTNRGELINKFEKLLKDRISSNYCLCINNGTIALQILLKSLKRQNGEIITTPFSYVATTSSIVWEGFKPIFIDLNQNSFNVNIDTIEEKITNNTRAILLTHIYGIPENIEAVEAIARKHNLPLFYDGAHAIGVKYKGKSLLAYGDASTCSFHATKLLHCGEGGAIFTNSKKLYDTCYKLHNFGHEGYEIIDHLGINGKMSELNAAMGLSVLPYLEQLIQKRKSIFEMYQSNLKTEVHSIQIPDNVEWNYSYFPILCKSESDLKLIQSQMQSLNIFPRRYFYPSLNTLPYLKYQKMENAESVSKRVLCLPFHHDLTQDDVVDIAKIVNKYY